MKNTLGYLHEVWLCPEGFGNLYPHASPTDQPEMPPVPSMSRAVIGYGRLGHRHMRRRWVFITNSSAMESTHSNSTAISFLIRKIGMSAKSPI